MRLAPRWHPLPNCSRYSMAPSVPAMPSWLSVPVSNLCGRSSPAGPHLVAEGLLQQLLARPTARPDAARTTCRRRTPEYRRRGPGRRWHSAAHTARHRHRRARPPPLPRFAKCFTSLTVPVQFDAMPSATSLVRRRQHLAQRVVGELVGLGIEIHPAHHKAQVFRQQQPGRHIGIVVHARQHDFVARLETPAEAARHVEGQARHVLAEHDFGGRAGIVEIGTGLMRLVDQCAGLPPWS